MTAVVLAFPLSAKESYFSFFGSAQFSTQCSKNSVLPIFVWRSRVQPPTRIKLFISLIVVAADRHVKLWAITNTGRDLENKQNYFNTVLKSSYHKDTRFSASARLFNVASVCSSVKGIASVERIPLPWKTGAITLHTDTHYLSPPRPPLCTDWAVNVSASQSSVWRSRSGQRQVRWAEIEGRQRPRLPLAPESLQLRPAPLHLCLR